MIYVVVLMLLELQEFLPTPIFDYVVDSSFQLYVFLMSQLYSLLVIIIAQNYLMSISNPTRCSIDPILPEGKALNDKVYLSICDLFSPTA